MPWRSSRHPRSRSRWCTAAWESEEHTSELQSRLHLVCRLLLEKKTTRRLAPPLHSSAGHQKCTPLNSTHVATSYSVCFFQKKHIAAISQALTSPDPSAYIPHSTHLTSRR